LPILAELPQSFHAALQFPRKVISPLPVVNAIPPLHECCFG
jgi:hypothetical protein